MKLPKSYYQGEDVLALSRDLLGKVLITNIDSVYTSGIIVETEAYNGLCDKACHAYNGRRTARTEVMYQEGGLAYVYLCYGIHSLFNIVTNREGRADAVLIRAIEPITGVEEMLKRRGAGKPTPQLTAGPGSLTEALNIKTKHTGTDLTGNIIWIEDQNIKLAEEQIVVSPRIGVAYAEEDSLLPWRFRIKDSKWTSKAK